MPEYFNKHPDSPIMSYTIRNVRRMDGKMVRRIVVRYGRNNSPPNAYTYTAASTSKGFMELLEQYLKDGEFAARHILGLTGRGEVRRRGGHAYRRKTRR